ncbi:GNAT family N-acetyltransferase [Anaerovorax odorimutans]|uniref:GNAT family N-acetyltransferase n=1 Tax=Anaerovorax odorimutans TaxID=109327 RepID=A0ABT1RQ11_9FIRM|nr:GNAT family N-acetyltransferase [Anaerovorax odorimutans]MCQ4637294.1 GNAT family N-acetyltransferase [Anaerovorax odorimutans]
MEFTPISAAENEKIDELSALATRIVRDYFTPIIGEAQNEYMIEKFQTPEAISRQIASGATYYFISENAKNIGFLSFYPKDYKLYLSKFYLDKEERGKGRATEMLNFVIDQALRRGLSSVFLNVNRNNPVIAAYEHMGFVKVREEKNDIGSGFFMDDYVMQCDLKQEYPGQGASNGTNGLYCQLASAKHLDGLAALWANEEVIRYTNIKEACSRQEAESRLAVFLDNQKKLDRPTIFTLFYDGEICGMAGCPAINEKEFGFFYQISRQNWGRGIGQKSAGWIIAYMRDNYPGATLYADAVTENIASIKILQKLGFSQTALHENAFERDGKRHDIRDFVLDI